MKAAVLHGNEDIRYEEWETPTVGPDSVKIRVRASGICGSDIPRVLHHGAHYYPIILGHEFSGDVEEVGADVTSVAVGDTVTGVPLLPCMKCEECQKGNYALCRHYSFVGSREQGSFADYVVLPERNVVKYDPKIPYVQGAMFEPSTVALHGVLCNEYKGGGYTAILGCGTIGIFTLQWVKIFGAKKVVVFDVDDGRLELARRMGADAVFNTKQENFKQEALAITQGAGYDSVFETAGNTETIRLGFSLAKSKAYVCCIGTPQKELNFTPDEWENMNRKEFHLTGSWMSYSAPFPGREWKLTADYFASGQLKFDDSFIYKTYPMAEAASAFEEFKHPGQVHGKIMLINE